MRVFRLDGPTIEIAHENTSGVNVAADQRGVPAVGATVDRNPVAIDNALCDKVIDGVEQVVVHLGAPLAVARVEEGLAVAGGTAEVDVHTGVAPVGQPLVFGIESPTIARPRTAVHDQHGGQMSPFDPRREAGYPWIGNPSRAVKANGSIGTSE